MRRIGIVREAFSAWERRAPFTPAQISQLVRKGVQVVVQPSGKRIFTDDEYSRAGAEISPDLSGCGAIFGVKQVPVDELLPEKTYLFFSHTIKGQLENMPLLDTVLERKIRLIDYECITSGGVQGNPRLVAFGEFAGKAGMINTFRGVGKQMLYRGESTPFVACGSAYQYPSYDAAAEAIRHMGRNFVNVRKHSPAGRHQPLIFTFTGSGNVNKGARTVFDLVPHEMVKPEALEDCIMNPGNYMPIIGCQVAPHDMVKRRDGGRFEKFEYYACPELYESQFYDKVLRHTNVLVNGIYWDRRFPRVLSKDDLAKETVKTRRLHFVSDISCDVQGGIEILERTTTIEDPFITMDGIDIMGVDILPSELPREASKHFGDYLMRFVPQLAEGAPMTNLSDELQGACIADEGKLTPRFSYIDSLRHDRERERKSSPPVKAPTKSQIEGSTVLQLRGHLFDTGLINQVLDVVEAQDPLGRFHIVDCHVGVHSVSMILLQITMDGGREQLDSVLERLSEFQHNPEFKIAEFQMIELPNSFCDGDFSATLPKSAPETKGKSQRRLTRKDSASDLDQGQTESQTLNTPSLTKVAVLGAGMVARPCVELLSRDASRHVYVASNMKEEAERLCRSIGRINLEPVVVDASDEMLEKLVEDSDVVISLLPQTMHVDVAKLCLKHSVPLATASYVSPEMQELEEEARLQGVPILCEMGLDPGMDHMSAKKIIDEIQSQGEKVRSFTSLCGGLAAPEAANNPFGYKFSWSPRGVLMAMKNKARFRHDGMVVVIDDLLASVKPFRMHNLPSLALEQLPNRDSTLYEEKYGIQGVETCFRGTLRYEGFSRIMNEFIRAGFLREDVAIDDTIDAFDRTNKPAADALDWLLDGTYAMKEFSGRPAMDAFCDILERKLPFQAHERDMTIMQHTFNGTNHVSQLIVHGNQKDSAMARTVGLTVGIAAEFLLENKTDKVLPGGIHIPTSKPVYTFSLDKLAAEDIHFIEFSK